MNPTSSDTGPTVYNRKTSFFTVSVSPDGVIECTEEDACLEELSRERKGRNISRSKMDVVCRSGEKPIRGQ